MALRHKINKSEGEFRQLDTKPPDQIKTHQDKAEKAAIFFKMGYQHQMDGQPRKAIVCYSKAKNIKPDLVEASYNMGIAYLDLADIDGAVTCFNYAVKLKPDYVDAYTNLGSCYRDRDEFEKAILCYRKAIELNPLEPKPHYNLGTLYLKIGKPADSKAYLQKALALKPDYALAYNSLGIALEMQGDLISATANYRKAAELQPDFAEAFYNLGNTLRTMGQTAAAIENYQQAVRLRGNYHDAYNNLGNLHKELSDLERARENYQLALKTKPDFAEAYYNLGNILHQQGNIPDAIDNFKHAIRLNSMHAEVHSNMGNAYKELGCYEDALIHYNQAITINRDLPEANFNRSIVYLLHQDFRRGWEGFEWRFKLSNPNSVYPHQFKAPRWDGRVFRGRQLLVHCEQGLGDTLQFVRYLPMVKALGGSVIFETRKELIKVIKDVPGIDLLIERSPDGNSGVSYDYHVPLMSLPAVFQTTIETIPSDIPYIFARDSKKDTWRKHIATMETKLKVGIVWAGKPGHTNDHNRSCGVDLFEPLSRLPGVRLYSLQKGQAAAQLKQLPDADAIADLGTEFVDFEDTAGAIANLDLIISVDTAVAHLAGAMGKPTWVLLPFVPDWRWMIDREDSPWYPTMRLFRQPETGDWPSVYQKLAKALEKLLRLRSAE